MCVSHRSAAGLDYTISYKNINYFDCKVLNSLLSDQHCHILSVKVNEQEYDEQQVIRKRNFEAVTMDFISGSLHNLPLPVELSDEVNLDFDLFKGQFQYYFQSNFRLQNRNAGRAKYY